ncbi:MAG: tetratricopeptide repeat protein [Bryobacterales bacterium]|nr:tetratricopeptide repeat protein [Bryobacterales bacterium]
MNSTFADIQAAVTTDPTNPVANFALGQALYMRGQLPEAVAILEKVATIAPSSNTLYRYARALLSVGRYDTAVEVLTTALVRDPLSTDLAELLAAAYLHLGQVALAQRLFSLLARQRKNTNVVLGLLECCLYNHPWKDGITEASRWLAPLTASDLRPYAGQALLNLGRLDEAEECLSTASIHIGDTLLGLGDIAYAKRDLPAAIDYHQRACSIHGVQSASIFPLFLESMSAAAYDKAYLLYTSARTTIRNTWGHGTHYQGLAPQWDGMTTIQGKTMLVHGCVGLGDTLQYIRFLPLLKQHGAIVLLEVPVPLVSLLSRLTAVDKVICKLDPLPPVDVECDIRELFLLLYPASLDGSLHKPYLQGRASNIAVRRDPEASVITGLVWDCGYQARQSRLWQRHIPIEFLQPLASVSTLDLRGLQVGPTQHALRSTRWGDRIPCLGDSINSMEDTAEILQNMDMLITVDTATAHLAGASGMKTYLLLPYVSSWRWGVDSHCCMWYPHIRLIRQSRPGDWRSSIEALVKAVTRAVDTME